MPDRENSKSPRELMKFSAIQPVLTVSEIVKLFQSYQELKKQLKAPGDFTSFRDSRGNFREIPSKQWRAKLQRFFGLSVSVELKTLTLPDGEKEYQAQAHAIHLPSGAYHEAIGVCSSLEKKRSQERRFHDAATHAETRAKNRAVLEFVGFGEISSEEISTENLTSPALRETKPAAGTWENTPATPKQIGAIITMGKQHGFSETGLKNALYDHFRIDSLTKLTKSQASEVFDHLDEIVREYDQRTADGEKIPEEGNLPF